MDPKNNSGSFYDWEKKIGIRRVVTEKNNIQEKLGVSRNEFLHTLSKWKKRKKVNTPFIEIVPSWKLGANYALIKIYPFEFKLYQTSNAIFKGFLRRLLEIFHYVNPNGFANDLREIIKEINEDFKDFKIKMDEYLRHY